MNRDKIEYQLEVSSIAEDILVIKGTIKEVLSLQYKDDNWLITAEIDMDQMKRSNRMGDTRLWLISIAISHNGYLVFNMGTRALVHNALIRTEDIWATSPDVVDWFTELERLRNDIVRDDNKDKLDRLNKLLLNINENIRRLSEEKEV